MKERENKRILDWDYGMNDMKEIDRPRKRDRGKVRASEKESEWK